MSPFADSNHMRLLLRTLSQVETATSIHDEADLIIGVRIRVRVILLNRVLRQRFLLDSRGWVNAVCRQ